MSFHYRSEGQLLCVRFLTDFSGSGIGFNITYSKVYSGTDLQVPEPEDIPTVAPVVPRRIADVQTYFRLPSKQARATLTENVEIGYKLYWVTSYRVGPSKKPFFDMLFTNSSLVDTLGVVDELLTTFIQTISTFAARGYFVTHLSSRARGRTPKAPSFSAVFTLTPSVMETTIYLGDTESEYLSRLADRRASGYQLVSHTFCEIQGAVQVASVYSIDKRRLLNISLEEEEEEEAALWQSFHSLTFLNFTTVALELNVQHFYPSSMEVSCQHGTSVVAAVFVQLRTDDNWFRWGLNTSDVRESVRDEVRSWQPRLTVAYNYINEVSHYLQFQRRSLY